MRIALATVGTGGDVRPFIALAQRLTHRGHEVTTVSWPVHADAFRGAGLRFIAAGPHAEQSAIDTAAASATAVRNPIAQVEVLRDFHLTDGEAHYATLVSTLAGHDLVVLHGIHALAHAAVLDLGVPWASAALDPVLLPTDTAPPPGAPNFGGPLNRLGWKLLDRMLGRVGRPLDAILAHAGSRQRGLPLFRARSERLHLVACSPAIAAVPPDLPPAVRFTGPWRTPVDAPLPRAITEFLADGDPPVVITFGSMIGPDDGALEDAATTLVSLGHRLIVQGLSMHPRAQVLNVGEVDHATLFSAASVIVHHGGAGTTHAACAAGVPSVVLPHIGDQRYWADRLHRLGVAPKPVNVRRLSGSRVADAIRATATSAAMRARARELATRLAREDGIGTAIAALEGLGR